MGLSPPFDKECPLVGLHSTTRLSTYLISSSLLGLLHLHLLNFLLRHVRKELLLRFVVEVLFAFRYLATPLHLYRLCRVRLGRTSKPRRHLDVDRARLQVRMEGRFRSFCASVQKKKVCPKPQDRQRREKDGQTLETIISGRHNHCRSPNLIEIDPKSHFLFENRN